MTVMVTRPVEQAGVLRSLLTELGADVIVQPAIQIDGPDDWTPVDAANQRIGEFHWVVFSSSNGVRYLCERFSAVERDLSALTRVKLAAIGPGTAHELAKYGLDADVVPQKYRAESLADSLQTFAARGQRFLLVRASRGREVLAERLAAAGGRVTQVVVYSSTDVAAPVQDVRLRLSRGEIDWVTVTSSAIARSLAKMFGGLLRKSRLVSISPVTSQTLRQLGYEPHAEATTYTMQGVAYAIRDAG
jgi:uroporphyrinogen III methyltransferase/synthase